MTIYESTESRNLTVSSSGAGYEIRFVVTGAADSEEAANGVLLETTPVLLGLIRKDIKVEPQPGGDLYFVVVSYEPGDLRDALTAPLGSTAGEGETPSAPGPDEPLDANVSFSTGGGTSRVYLSRETRGRYKAGGGAADDNRQAIGLADGSVEGVDIVTANGEFSVTRKRRFVTLNYLRTLLKLTGTTNKSTFWGLFVRGELLYLGAEGSGSNLSGWDITHKFRYAEDQPAGDARNIITPDLTITAGKRGHEYTWSTYKEVIEGGKKFPRADAVYVEVVYPETEFSQLEIG